MNLLGLQFIEKRKRIIITTGNLFARYKVGLQYFRKQFR